MSKLLLAPVFVCIAASAFAQGPPEGGHIIIQDRQMLAMQQGGNVSFGSPGPRTVVAGAIGMDGRMGLLNVTGKPFSATETRRTVQPLVNGAKIERSDSNLLYRDDQGRTRAEQTVDGKTIVVIMDPVAKAVLILNPERKSARRVPIPGSAQQGNVSVTNGGVTMLFGSVTGDAHSTQNSRVEMHMGSIGQAGIAPRTPIGGKHTTDDLGAQYVNGVQSQGTRDTQIIPAGSIGNDRELQVIDEHWFSNDLQMLIKSFNSDPRFGETTYQLTNIVRAPQDPSLFQVPADYTTTEEARPILK